MRRAMTVLSVLALAALAAGSASAQVWEYMDAAEGPVNTTDPHATTEGAIWINSGGTITLLDQERQRPVNGQLPNRGLDVAHRFTAEWRLQWPGHQHAAPERLRCLPGHS